MTSTERAKNSSVPVSSGLIQRGLTTAALIPSFSSRSAASFGHGGHVAQPEDRHARCAFLAVSDHFGLADFQQLRLGFGPGSNPRPAGIADGDGTLVVVRHRPEHVGEFLLVLGLHEDQVRDVAQVADVEQAVVRRAVVAAETGAVHAQAHVEVLERHVVNDHVVGALHERRVDRQKRLHPLDGQTAGEKRGVFLGDADIVVFLWMPLLETPEAGAAGHGPGDGDDLLVAVREVGQRVAEIFGISGQRRRRRLARVELVAAQAMEFVRLFERGRVSLPLSW